MPWPRAWLKIALDGAETNCMVAYAGLEVLWSEGVELWKSIFLGL
jgi:hypothetical protein